MLNRHSMLSTVALYVNGEKPQVKGKGWQNRWKKEKEHGPAYILSK